MIASAHRAPVDADRSRRAADSPSRLSMGTFVLAATLCFLAILSSSHALQCACNDEAWYSDCRWQSWTCTEVSASGACFARRWVQEDGTTRHETGCVRTDWNPTHCTGGRDTPTDVYACCWEDMCNEDLEPIYTEPATTTPVTSVSSMKPSAVEPSVVEPSATEPSAVEPSAVEPSVSLTLSSGLIETPQPSSSVTTVFTTCKNFTTPILPSPSPTSLPPGMLQCECSRSLCRKSSCVTNYKCFRDARYIEISDYIETRLGCLEHIVEGDDDILGMCNRTRDSATYELACCDDEDMCNRGLNVVVGRPTVPSTSPDTTEPPTEDTTGSSSGGNDDSLFLSLSIAVVTITTVVVVVILVVLGIFCLRYQRDKAKVTSVDHFQSEVKGLPGANPTYMVKTIHVHRTDCSQPNHYV